MKLLTLELCGIGPFASRQFIDFQRFTDAGLFLLRGATGSGKSTLIDAIVFGLYGDVASGNDGAKNRLRSLYCAPNGPSYVEVVFEVSAGIYRVHRTPQYVKEGRATPVNATVTFAKVAPSSSDPSGFSTLEALSRSIPEAQSMITSLIGLTKEQFLQTVVLPQGQFARFLSAKSSDREKILRDIFGTQYFQDLQDAFVEAAKSADESITRTRRDFSSALGMLQSQVTDSPLGESLSEELTKLSEKLESTGEYEELNADLLTLSGHLNDLLKKQCDDAQRTLETAQVLLDQRNAELNAAQDLHQRFNEYKLLTAQQAALLSQESQIDSLIVKETHLRSLEPLKAPLQQFDSAQSKLAQAHSSLEKFISLPERMDGALFDTTQAHTELSAGNSELLSEYEKVSDASHVHQQLVDARMDYERLTAQEIQAHQLIEELKQRSDALLKTRTELTQKIEASQEARPVLASSSAQLDTLNQRVDVAERADILRAQLIGLAEEIQKAHRTARERGITALLARETWLQETAASLAAELEEDTPCPVCGSTLHPSPAQSDSDNTMSRQKLDELEALRQDADQHLHELSTQRSQCVAQIAALNEQAGSDSESLRIQRDALRQTIVQLNSLAENYQALSAEFEATSESEKEILSARASTQEKLTNINSRIQEVKAQISAYEASLAQALGDYTSLEEWKEALERKQDHQDAFSQALNSFDQAAQLFQSNQEYLNTALLESGYEDGHIDLNQIREELKDLPQLEGLSQQIRHHHQELHTVQARLNSERFSGLETAEAPDLDACEIAREEAREEELRANSRLAGIQAHAKSIHRSETQLHSALTELSKALKEGYPRLRLAQLAGGNGQASVHRVPLSSWILMSRFEELISAANPRLAEISHGRYELQRSDTDPTRSRKNGLGLLVFDHEAENARTPSTLSGGETFYVSLALALGLADVVMAESGGIMLSSMFIDEGFGSLDLETLDIVMAQLLALRKSDRCIGVISHVDEMARQIADQIQVTWKEGRGSTLSIRGA